MRVIGMVSEADLLLKEANPALPQGSIRLAWRSPAVTISENASVGEAARLMQSRRVKRLPVVDHDGMLHGIVSRAVTPSPSAGQS